jgi:hypothetical protein
LKCSSKSLKLKINKGQRKIAQMSFALNQINAQDVETDLHNLLLDLQVWQAKFQVFLLKV